MVTLRARPTGQKLLLVVSRLKKRLTDSLLRWGESVHIWHKWAGLKRGVGVLRESMRYILVRPDREQLFHVVSCERNAGDAALTCLDSVHRQADVNVRHLFIDDASTDQTDDLIRDWLERHPGHRVDYVHNTARKGGTVNTIEAFRRAPPGAIAVELNGDDWLPDRYVLSFLSKVYRDSAVWMTYNTMKRSDGAVFRGAAAAPRLAKRNCEWRSYGHWITQHLHTFRKELFDHVREESLVDPQSGEYWESADDIAIHMSMLELAGRHARHIHRVTYIYNYRPSSHVAFEREATQDRERRIRQLPRYEPLERL